MRIAVAQIDPIVGAFDSNVQKINEAYEKACAQGASLMITPELSLCGYPPLDLLVRSEIFERSQKALLDCISMTKGKSCRLLVGHVSRNQSRNGRRAKNDISIIENGKIIFSQSKKLLPTYDVFDEARYFEAGKETKAWKCDGKKVAFAICEDLWASDPSFDRKIYGNHDPVDQIAEINPDLLISISASPYQFIKKGLRIEIHQEIAKKLNVPLVYINQSGCTDEILFDGASFALNRDGSFAGRLPSFQVQTAFVDLDEDGQMTWKAEDLRTQVIRDPMDTLVNGIVTGIRDYFHRTGFKKAVLGLSGGIDSALVAALAVKALGAKNVIGISMPGLYSSSHSIEDAEVIAKKLGIRLEIKPIKFLYSNFKRELSEGRGELEPIALENLQARIRGMILMTLANHEYALTLVTSNKSELAVGYSTLYGDMAGALAPIGDIFKTRVYEMARWINNHWGNWIPRRSIEKPPSAELKPDQKDTDTLPPYDVLDRFLEGYIEKTRSIVQLSEELKEESKEMEKNWMEEVARRIERSEYKRRQAAPVLRVSPRAFGIGRRIPIAKVWNA